MPSSASTSTTAIDCDATQNVIIDGDATMQQPTIPPPTPQRPAPSSPNVRPPKHPRNDKTITDDDDLLGDGAARSRSNSPDLLAMVRATEERIIKRNTEENAATRADFQQHFTAFESSLSRHKLKTAAALKATDDKVSNHDKRIGGLEAAVTSLQSQLGVMALATPDRDPATVGNNPNRLFDAPVDVTILRINTHDRIPVAKEEVIKLLGATYLTIGLGPEFYTVLGNPIGTDFVIQFKGDAGFAERKQEESHAALKDKLNNRKDLVVPAPTGSSQVKLYVKRDQNPKMRSAEILSKKFLKIVVAHGYRARIKPSQGLLFSTNWHRLALITPVAGGGAPSVDWNVKLAISCKLDPVAIREQFLAELAERATAEAPFEWSSV